MTLPALDPNDLGTDVDILAGLSLRWNLVTGKANLARAIARRLSTPHGSLDWDEDFGFDLMGSLNAGMTATQLSQLRGNIVAEVKKEPRVDDCQCTVNFNAATQALTVTLNIQTANGPFPLVLLVTQLTVEILNQDRPTDVLPPGTAGATINIGQVGPPGPPGAATSGGGGGGTGTIDLSFPKEMASNSGAAEVVGQLTCDFGLISNGTVGFSLTGFASSASGTATFKLYVGGTFGAVDGTLVGTGTIAVASPTMLLVTGTFTNPTGARAVKVVIQSSAAGVDGALQDATISLH